MLKKAVLVCLILLNLSCILITSAEISPEISPDQGGSPAVSGLSGLDIQNETGFSNIFTEKKAESTTFVKNGAEYAENNSKEKALAAFNDVHGGYVDGERYLFGYDINGTTLVQPYKKELLGTNRLNLTDVNGVKLIQTQELLAGYGGGYAFTIYSNPNKNFTEMVKYNYIHPVNEFGYLGSGFFIPQINPVVDKGAISELVSRVRKAAELGEKEGKETAPATFNNLNNTSMTEYADIFAFDYNGTILSMPYQPDIIGTDSLNKTDAYGTPIYRLAIDIAKSGGGFEYFALYDPDSGKENLKFCYVLPVHDNWLVGSGISFWDGL